MRIILHVACCRRARRSPGALRSLPRSSTTLVFRLVFCFCLCGCFCFRFFRFCCWCTPWLVVLPIETNWASNTGDGTYWVMAYLRPLAHRQRIVRLNLTRRCGWPWGGTRRTSTGNSKCASDFNSSGPRNAKERRWPTSKCTEATGGEGDAVNTKPPLL